MRRRSVSGKTRKRGLWMDCRIKSGNDERKSARTNGNNERKEKGKRNADKRSLIFILRATPADVATGRRFGRGSPVGVPPRFWLRRPNATTQLQFRATRDEAAVGLSPELASLGTAMLLADRS